MKKFVYLMVLALLVGGKVWGEMPPPGPGKLSYNNNIICNSLGVLPETTASGNADIFISIPASLAIDSANGTIFPSISSVGSYHIQRIRKSDSLLLDSAFVTIISFQNYTLTYPAFEYCSDDNVFTPLGTSSLRDSFYYSAILPSGNALSINDSTGFISPILSDTGIFKISRTDRFGCSNTPSDTIKISPRENANFSYPLNNCTADDTIYPVLSGIKTGVFSQVFGAIINFQASSGKIIPLPADAGTYTMQRRITSTCGDTAQATLTITQTPAASFYYQDSILCANSPMAFPTPTGSVGGTYSSNTSGLILNATSGELAPSPSRVGVHTVYYNVGGICPSIDSFEVSILAVPNPDFYYPNVICLSDSNALPDSVETQGGQWSCFPGTVNIDPGTGEMIFAPTDSGYIFVAYTLGGTCPSASTQLVYLQKPTPAGFHYPVPLACQDGITAPVITTAYGGGIYSVIPPSGLALDTLSGHIQLDSSDVGSYIITYTPNGTCVNTQSDTLQVISRAHADFKYENADFSLRNVYCLTDTHPQPITLPNFTSGGTFSVDLGVGAVDPATGAVLLNQCQDGLLRIKYVVASISGGCADSAYAEINLVEPNATLTLDYGSNFYCRGSQNPVPVDTLPFDGYYESPPSLTQYLSPTGEVSLSSAPAGTHQIIYLSNGVCRDSSNYFTLTISEQDTIPIKQFEDVCQGDGILSPTLKPFWSLDSLGRFIAFEPDVLLIQDSIMGIINLTQSQGNQTHFLSYFTNGSCPNDTSFSFYLYNSPEVDLISNSDVNVFCEEDEIFFQDLATSNNANYQFWVNGQLAQNSSASDFFPASGFMMDGDSIWMVKTYPAGNCATRDSLSIVIIDAPDLFVEDHFLTISQAEPVKIQVIPNIGSSRISWEVYRPLAPELTYTQISDTLNAGMPFFVQDSTPNPYPNSPDSIRITLVGLAGSCEGPIEVVWIVRLPGLENVFIPGLLTPNGDGKNDEWQFAVKDGSNPDDYRIILLNRSGGKVWSQETLRNPWTPNNVPDGVYWWVLEENANGKMIQNGGLTIRRN